MPERRTDLAESLRSIPTARSRRLARPDVVALIASVDTAVPAKATIDLPSERRRRTAGAVVPFSAAAAEKSPESAPPTRAAHSALEPGTAALDNALRVPRSAALSVTDGVSAGDEYAVVLPDTTSEGAMGVGDRSQTALTVPVGVATLPVVSIAAAGSIHGARYYLKDWAKNGIHVAG